MSQQLEATPLFQKTHITIIPDDLRISLTSAGTRNTHGTQTYKHKALGSDLSFWWRKMRHLARKAQRGPREKLGGSVESCMEPRL